MPPQKSVKKNTTRTSALTIEIAEHFGRMRLNCSGPNGALGDIGCRLQVSEIPKWRRNLGIALQRVKKQIGNSLTLSFGQKLDAAIADLQQIGDEFAGLLFGHSLPRASELFKEASPHWQLAGLEDELPDAPLPSLIVVQGSIAQMLPLEFLPLYRSDSGGSPRSRVNIRSNEELRELLREFVGFTSIVRRVAECGETRSTALSLTCSPKMRIKIFVHRGLKGVCNELRFFEQHADLHPEIWPTRGVRGNAEELAHHLWHTHCGVDRLPRSPFASDQIHHFSTHVTTPFGKPHSIRLAGCNRSAFDASLSGINAALGSLYYQPLPNADNRPLVVMNACGTSRIDPDGVTSLPDMFLNSFQCRGYIGTETTMSDAVAAQFSYQFYGRMLSGIHLGDALHKTQWSLVHQHRNPLGLFYSCYADADLHIQRVNK